MKVAIVIPVWNQMEYTLDVLRDLAAQTQPVRVFLVDNGSTDGTEHVVMHECEKMDIVYIRNETNLRCARAWNQGVMAAVGWGAEYIGMFNNDLVVPPWIVEGLVKGLDLTSSSLRWGPTTKPPIIVSPDYSKGELSRFFLDRTRIFHEDLQERVVFQISRPHGFCFMFPAWLLDKIEPPKQGAVFEEAFGGVWYEDDDFFQRTSKVGRMGILPHLLVHHFESKTLEKLPTWREEAREAGRRYQEKYP